jgi:AcrR family transcriptional regulator
MEDNEVKQVPESTKDDGSARSRLMEAATKLFAEHGLEGTSTRDIAKAADLNISLISYYFGGKEGLYRAIIVDFAHQAKAHVENFLQPIDLKNLTRDDFKLGMRRFIQGMMPMKLATRDHQKILHRELLAGLPHARDVHEDIFAKILETIAGVYRAGQEKGFIRKELNPYIIFFSMTHATDLYLQMSQCKTQVQCKLIKVPDDLNDYVEQIYLLFVEGVLI